MNRYLVRMIEIKKKGTDNYSFKLKWAYAFEEC